MSQRVRLGRTGLMVSPICFGTWQLSPRFWGPQPEEVLVDAMRRAFEIDVNFYDTADAYGEGLAEEVMGKALADVPRDQIVVATKVYWQFPGNGSRYGDLSKEHILQACEASLRRLKMEYVDLYQCHAYDPLATPDQIVEAMETLVKQGKIRWYGSSNWTVEQMRTGNARSNFATCQPRYSLLKREIEADVLPYCQANDIGVLVYSPLHMGLLSGKYRADSRFDDLRKNNPDFQGQRLATIVQRLEEVGQIAQRYQMTTVQLVLAVTLMHPAITCAIVGVKKFENVQEAAGAMGQTISREDWNTVRRLLTV